MYMDMDIGIWDGVTLSSLGILLVTLVFSEELEALFSLSRLGLSGSWGGVIWVFFFSILVLASSSWRGVTLLSSPLILASYSFSLLGSSGHSGASRTHTHTLCVCVALL